MSMECNLCIFLENGHVYGYFKTTKMIGLHEFNYGEMHKVQWLGSLPKKDVKTKYPHASFIDFNKLGKNRIERKKIIEIEESLIQVKGTGAADGYTFTFKPWDALDDIKTDG
jgi:hypothetical protein